MKNFLESENMGLLTCKRQTSSYFQHVFITDKISERCSVSLQTGEVSYVFPLYLYHEDETKTVNFKVEILEKIKSNLEGEVSPENILDYIYAILHSPSYREKYKEFLKIDFPRVPYPASNETFWKLAQKGSELRALHLLESPKLQNFITTFPESGSDIVKKIKFEDGKVFINEDQYFGNVPEVAWNFFVGGYQPAQKWLKDRKSKTLSSSDFEHWQKIIIALNETDRIMKEIDTIGF
jgi:predicted helicase